ncbi:MAG: hypothetical protein NTY33_00530 [Candidatus Moranbacteria bacterium]|nr:hypothetical protein [Candidatus Moranbacteria bacterium]
MPNIEQYGFSVDEALGIDSMIHDLFENKPYRNDYVTTFIESDVRDHRNKKQPFLRLVTTKDKHTDDIINELKKLKFDIEVMPLNLFIPKE